MKLPLFAVGSNYLIPLLLLVRRSKMFADKFGGDSFDIRNRLFLYFRTDSIVLLRYCGIIFGFIQVSVKPDGKSTSLFRY